MIKVSCLGVIVYNLLLLIATVASFVRGETLIGLLLVFAFIAIQASSWYEHIPQDKE